MEYDINILVNGSRCKQYTHNGKVFIEAKDGSEYSIEIKNNTWRRILAVCSVDGLDILNGKPAEENGNGYVISGYNSAKLDGFRVSDDKVAKFIFGAKHSSYASTKGNNAERNVGVIGVRLFEEKVYPPIYNQYKSSTPRDTGYPTPVWCDMTYGNTCDTLGFDTEYDMGSSPTSATYSSDNMTKGCSPKGTIRSFSGLMGAKLSSNKPSFDMGTKFGESKDSRVVEVSFEKGILAITSNIYYASRQSLLEMGVPLGNEKQISFPEPFVGSKYATPPKNWQG